MRLLLLVLALLFAAGPALAVLPEEQLPDPAMEARARKLSKELRCVVCQNQTIDDSDAPLAADLRAILRERIKAGDTDAQARAYLVDRYGDFVLLKPPMTPATLLLWFGPALALALGGFGVWRYWRGRAAPAAPEPLDEAERARLAALLSEADKP
ncbi:MAG TPA: cytochrome c-type biogenesis protein [Caulobacter sp.]|nr:cytochrome c-type biogenesis protein [Caulobacter sp.]